MAGYIEVNGASMWYDEHGTGEPLILLHGGFSDARDFAGNLLGLADRFRVLTPERRGHGHTPDTDGPFSHGQMADDTIAFCEALTGGPVRLVGYSDGAYVALLVALRRPDLVNQLVVVSAGVDPDAWLALPDADGEMPAVVVDAYAEVSPDGRDHFPVIQAKVAAMVADDKGEVRVPDLATIGCRTLVVAADDDLVHLEHTLELYRTIPGSELAVVPGTSHTLLMEKPAACTRLVADFLTADPVPTFIPIRRAG